MKININANKVLGIEDRSFPPKNPIFKLKKKKGMNRIKLIKTDFELIFTGYNLGTLFGINLFPIITKIDKLKIK